MGQPQSIKRFPVLIIEDEPVLRSYVLDMVEEAGCEAVEATSVDDALSVLEVRDDIRLVYMDLDMPCGVKGIEIAASIRDRWPPIETILTAAFFNADDIRLPKRAEFYPKPIRPDQVIAAMRRMTARVESA